MKRFLLTTFILTLLLAQFSHAGKDDWRWRKAGVEEKDLKEIHSLIRRVYKEPEDYRKHIDLSEIAEKELGDFIKETRNGFENPNSDTKIFLVNGFSGVYLFYASEQEKEKEEANPCGLLIMEPFSKFGLVEGHRAFVKKHPKGMGTWAWQVVLDCFKKLQGKEIKFLVEDQSDTSKRKVGDMELLYAMSAISYGNIASLISAKRAGFKPLLHNTCKDESKTGCYLSYPPIDKTSFKKAYPEVYAGEIQPWESYCGQLDSLLSKASTTSDRDERKEILSDFQKLAKKAENLKEKKD